MSETKTVVSVNPLWRVLYVILCVATAIVGYQIHGSLFWAIMDFFFAPIAWAKWLICQEVNITIIKQAFAFFLK